MGILDVLKKRKTEEEVPISARDDFPNDLEQFKLEPPRIEEKPSPFARQDEKKFSTDDKPFVPQDIMEKSMLGKKSESGVEKIDLILSKLETIDARLRLIEEKLK